MSGLNRRCTANTAALALTLLTAAPAAANPVHDLPGYWTGTGSVTMANGATEQVKCAVTYKVTGQQVKQSLRCASPAYNINASADFSVNGSQVSGNWEEKNYSTTGAISGRVTGSGFALSIDGATFSAAMNVSSSSCKQSINISPRGTDVTKISIGLGKC